MPGRGAGAPAQRHGGDHVPPAAAPASPPAAPTRHPVGPPAGRPDGPPGGRTRRSRKPVLAAAGALVAAAAVVTATVVPGWLRAPTPPAVDAPPGQKTAAGGASREPAAGGASREASPGSPAAPVKTRLPGGAITLYERPSAPITLTAYEVYDEKLDEDVDYARRSLRGTFDRYPGNVDSLVSPDGRYLAGRPDDYTSDGYDSILVTDRQAGSSFRVKTVRKPLDTSIRAWSKDGSKLLLNLDKKTENKQGEDVWTTLGFAVLDVARATVRVVEVADDTIRSGNFGWDGAEEGVVAFYGDNEGLRFFDAAGRRVRDVPKVGPPASGTVDLFSPSGGRFVTDCPGDDEGDHCLWDTATGKRAHRFSSDCDKVLGWYDESHLYCWEYDNGPGHEIRVVAFDGRLTHLLLESGDGMEVSPYFTVTPSGS
ncbi:hypothetical protein [Nonomuraea candida]|uniref:hypothetical protein n=1 Tax=Nonomuraea candida TaxID=359159 RepID=UPI001FDF4BEB|nr:hypothetical protein [Nonomuraea candida]